MEHGTQIDMFRWGVCQKFRADDCQSKHEKTWQFIDGDQTPSSSKNAAN